MYHQHPDTHQSFKGHSFRTRKMKTITAITMLAALASAAPAAEHYPFQAQITLQGAAGAAYTLEVPTDGSVFYICMLFSASQPCPTPNPFHFLSFLSPSHVLSQLSPFPPPIFPYSAQIYREKTNRNLALLGSQPTKHLKNHLPRRCDMCV